MSYAGHRLAALPLGCALAAVGLAAALPAPASAAQPFDPSKPLSAARTSDPLRLPDGRLRLVIRDKSAKPGRLPWRLRPGTLAELQRLLRSRSVEYAEPDYPVAPAFVPNDPLFGSQGPFFTDYSKSSMRTAWEATRGATADGRPIAIAVLDSGINSAEPELAGRLWTNPGEVAGNGRDDDGNGYVDDVHGVDLSGSGTAEDRYGHGTAAATVIAARGNNGRGMAGVAYAGRVMNVKVLDNAGAGTASDLAEGIVYAVHNGARVLSISLVTYAQSAAVDEALQIARDAGVLVVAAAGNDRRNLDAHPAWPVSSPEPNVIGVAALEGSRRASFSNYGSMVDVAAPGINVLSIDLSSAPTGFTGTSAAAPLVAGTGALLFAEQPQADGVQVRAALMASLRGVSGLGADGIVRPGLAAARFATQAQVDRAQRRFTRLKISVRVRRLSGGRRRVEGSWRLADKPTSIRSVRADVHRKTLAGARVGTHSVRTSRTSGSIPSVTFRRSGGSRMPIAVRVRVTSRNGVTIGDAKKYVSIR